MERLVREYPQLRKAVLENETSKGIIETLKSVIDGHKILLASVAKEAEAGKKLAEAVEALKQHETGRTQFELLLGIDQALSDYRAEVNDLEKV